MDPVWGVTSTDEHLWVATTGGLLRYPLDGGAPPLRVAGQFGPGGTHIAAVDQDPDGGVWALSDGGIGRYAGGSWGRPTKGIPALGQVTSFAVGDKRTLWVGGSTGLALWNGRWRRYSAPTSVTTLAAHHTEGSTEVWAGTESKGIFQLSDNELISEHPPGKTLPCDGPVHSIVTTDSEVWALCERDSRSVLARYDGTGWNAYTAKVRQRPKTLGVCGDRVLVLAERELWRIAKAPDEPPENEVELIRVARGHAPASRHKGTLTEVEAEDSTKVAPQSTPPAFAPLPTEIEVETAGRSVLRRVEVDVPSDPSMIHCDDRGIWVGSHGLGVLRVRGRDEAVPYRTMDLIVTERPFTVAAAPDGGAWLLTSDLRAGMLGQSQFEPGVVEPDVTSGVQLLAFGSRGLGSYALGRLLDRNVIRIYQLGEQGWELLLSRSIRVPGDRAEDDEGDPPRQSDTIVDLSFFEVDPRGRFWIGLLVPVQGRQEPIARGIMVIDREEEEVTYHGRHPSGPGGVEIPDEIAAVAFTRAGDAWLGGLNGAILLGLQGEPQRFGESNGLRGDIVNDIEVDSNDIPWVVTPAGVGRYQDNTWRFFLDALAPGVHVATLAIDSRGEVWAGGNRGAVHYDGDNWEVLTRVEGLISDRIQSVHVDGQDRVWFVTDQGLSLLARQ